MMPANYRKALPPKHWPMAVLVMQCLTAMGKHAARTGQRVNFDLAAFAEAIRERARETMI